MEGLKRNTRLIRALPRDEGETDSFLLQIHGSELGRRSDLHPDRTRIGRGDSCDLVLDSDSVSRIHCTIFFKEGEAFLEDEGSTNGSWVNGRRILVGEIAKLSSGDRIQIGELVFKFLRAGDVEVSYHEELRRLVITDGLTGAFNKRYLLERLESEVARCLRHGRSLALLLFDIDHFKKLNDTHGHLAGDRLLEGLVARIQSQFLRQVDCLARFGGEEFALILPEAERDAAAAAAERLRRLVEREPFDHGGTSIPMTISVGVGVLDRKTRTALGMLAAADEKLYEAKRQGRNRVGV